MGSGSHLDRVGCVLQVFSHQSFLFIENWLPGLWSRECKQHSNGWLFAHWQCGIQLSWSSETWGGNFPWNWTYIWISLGLGFAFGFHQVGADVHSRKKFSFSSERLSETVSLRFVVPWFCSMLKLFFPSEKSATVSLAEDGASTRALAGSLLGYRLDASSVCSYRWEFSCLLK